jgi:hypothetical protein
VPNGALLSAAKMRVTMNRLNNNTSCGTFANGEVEDYDVNIVASAAEEDMADEGLRMIAGNDISYSNDIRKARLTVTPNPFTDLLKISLQGVSKPTTITLRNVMGMILYKKVLAAGIKEHSINTSLLPAGMYYVLVENETGQHVLKAVK